MNKNDKRYLRTHTEIRKRFEELILEKELEEITISELARRAGINRKTFYLHFGSLDDILEEIQEEIMKDLSGLEQLERFSSDPFNFEGLIAGFSAILSKNIPLHRRIFCSGGYRFVFEHIRSTVTKRYIRAIQERISLDDEYVEIATSFVSYGILFVFRDWLASKNPMDITDLTRFTARLIRHATEGMLADAALAADTKSTRDTAAGRAR